MKKPLTVFIVIAILLFLCSCDKKPEKTSDAMYQIGINALANVDKYIQGEITGTEADASIDEFYSQAKTLIKQERKDFGKEYLFGTDFSNDESIESDLSILSLTVCSANNGIRTMSDVKENRDKLAETLGKKKKEKSKNTTEQKTDNYTYEQEQEIVSLIKEDIPFYGLEVFISEKENGISIDISSKEKENNAEYYFSDILPPSIEAVSQAKNKFGFNVSELRIGFLLYQSNFDEGPTGTITYTTKDLEKGMLIFTNKQITKSNITIEQAIEILKQN